MGQTGHLVKVSRQIRVDTCYYLMTRGGTTGHMTEREQLRVVAEGEEGRERNAGSSNSHSFPLV